MFFGGDPFEHFAHGGMGGGPRGAGGRAPPRNVDTTKLYETLGVSHYSPVQFDLALLVFRNLRRLIDCFIHSFSRWLWDGLFEWDLNWKVIIFDFNQGR